ncbi:hypothetical protein C1H46_038691 [Malus baccata]|uniref:Knottin scorpion toxin-like domain-containing protein n=1 Tax=Malus baccata TaxID=106549 RepID=A0A540KNI6_MALBA|nr:hypothetical protein C1H46_038691 [Malus baccata]
MKRRCLFPLLILLILLFSNGALEGQERNCSNAPIPVKKCSKYRCVIACMDDYNQSFINGGCMDYYTCCCKDLEWYSNSCGRFSLFSYHLYPKNNNNS